MPPQALPPEEVLQKFNGKLFTAIQSPQALAHYLYAEKFIGADIVNDLPSMRLSEGKSKLLAAVRASVKVSDHKVQDLKTFLMCLERIKEPTLNALALELDETILSK